MRQTLLVALLLTAICVFAESRPPSAIGNVGSRTTISLDGNWNTIIDPYETGLGSRFYENAKPKTKSDLVEYDFEHSPKLHVPGDWNTQRESLLFYEGISEAFRITSRLEFGRFFISVRPTTLLGRG